MSRYARGWIVLLLLLAATTAPAVVPMVSITYETPIALKADGTAYAWGNNVFGQIGDGSESDRATPVQVPLTNVRAVQEFGLELWAALGDGSVYAWGGLRPRSPTRVDEFSNVVAFAFGHRSAILKGDGSVCVGLPCTPVAGLPRIVAIAGAQTSHLLALAADGTVWAWGFNGAGQLGDGTTTARETTPAGASGLAGVVAISAAQAAFHTSLALKRDGTVWQWGAGRLTPTQVSGLSGIVAIAAIGNRGTAVKADGTVWEWGNTAFGGISATPVSVPGISNAIAIWGGGNGQATFVMKADGTLLSYGSVNARGQLGYGEFGGTALQARPVLSLNLLGGAAPNALPQAAFTTDVQADATGYAVRCNAGASFDPDGTVTSYQWSVSDGQSATGLTPAFHFAAGATPTIELTVRDDRQATARASTTVLPPRTSGRPHIALQSWDSFQMHAVRNDGVLYAWGSNNSGELGTGTVFDRTVPGRVALLNGVTAVSAGLRFSLALRDDGTVWSWGNNLEMQLGAGISAGRSLVPLKVVGMSQAVAVAAGSRRGVAAKSDGTVWEWGATSSGEVLALPRQVQGLDNVVAVAAGSSAQVALKRDGTVWAWGSNFSGELGQGNANFVAAPVQLGIQNVVAVSMGYSHGLAVKSDGSLWIWGDNENGALGIGAAPRYAPPTQVPGLSQVTGAAAGYRFNVVLRQDGTVHAFGRFRSMGRVNGIDNAIEVAAGIASGAALRADGLIWTWGYNDTAVLGDGTYVDRDDAVVVLAEDGLGSLDRNDWYLDLDPAASLVVPPSATPTAIAFANRVAGQTGTSLDARIRYRTGEYGRALRNYVLGLVPPSFLDLVKTVPGTPKAAQLRAKAGNDPILVQLTADGWAIVAGSLTAYSQSTASANGAGATVLANTPIPAGSRFCIGYGENAEGMLGGGTMRDILADRGATSNTTGLPCVLSGVYVDGPAASVSGTPVTFNASVVGLSPTGQVQFRDNSAVLGTAQTLSLVAPAVSRASISPSLALGSHAIGADYSGDSNRNAPSSSALALAHQVVAAAAGSAVVTLSGPSSSSVGEEVGFTATVAGNRPGGSVQFKEGNTVLGTEPVIGSVATLRLRTLALGSHSIVASYQGDANNGAATSASLSHTVTYPPESVVALAASAARVTAGASLTLTATVSARRPTGVVEFRAGDALLASTMLQNAVATATLASIGPGTHYISATYLGDGTNLRATSPAVFVSVEGDVNVTLAPAVLDFGTQSLGTTSAARAITITNSSFGSLTVTSVASSAQFPATHNCATLSAGSSCTAMVAFAPAAAGAHSGTLTASTGAGSVVAQLAGTGQQVTTTTSVASSQNPATTGQAITLTAAVSASSGTPAGTVTFKDGTATLCASVALASAQAQCASSTLAAGSHQIAAEYSGNATFAPSVSAALTQIVQAPSSPTISVDPPTLAFGGQSMATTSAARTITVTNSGSTSATVSSVSVSGTQFAASHDCSALAPAAKCTVQVTFAPAVAAGALNARVAVTGSLTLSTNPGGAAASVVLTGTTEKSLVSHYYRSILRRSPDSAGQDYWEAEAARLAALGANVNEAWFALAMSFYNSAEYLALGRNPTEFVRDLYSTFFNRTADNDGLAYWTGEIARGLPGEQVLMSFLFSSEFTKFTQAIFGNTAARSEVDTVVDFYRGLLARLPDSPGFTYWVGQFRAAQCQGASAVIEKAGAISSAYAGSDEYAARKRTNAQYVGDLYNAFLRRGGDLAGVQFWIGELDKGARTRDRLLQDFRESKEFTARVSALVAQGCLQGAP